MKMINKRYIYIYADVNIILVEENVIQIKSGIKIKVDVTVKHMIYVKKVIFWILILVVSKMEKI